MPHNTTGLINRPRLLEKLREALNYRLTLISAPPGYGKTTLAAQFARQMDCPLVWHTIEERERDVPNLHARSISVLNAVVPGIKTLAPGPGFAPSELASLVADHLRETLTGDIIYILDDVHHLAGSTAAEAWLRKLVLSVPSTCHLILISRMLPDLPLVEMIARREVLAIGQEHLRLTPQEVHELAHEVLGQPLPDEKLHELSTRLEGWPAGLVLALHPLPSELERAMLHGEGPEALFDALADLMLRAQPPGVRDFLLASSTLTRLTPELCTVALGLPDSAERLAELQIRNLFLSRVSGGLTYHMLFRSFLQRYLKENDPDLYTSLHLKAACWFEAQDQVDEAFDHYMAAGCADTAAGIAERVAQVYFSQGKVETLVNWGTALRQVGAQSPRLLYTCAIVHTDRYDYATAAMELAQAQILYAERRDGLGLLQVQLQQAWINLQRGFYEEAATQATLLAEMNMEGADGLQARALTIHGLARLRLGDTQTALQQLETALPLYRADGDAYAISQMLQDLSMVYMQAGRLGDASACLQEVVALQRSFGSRSALALALNNLGYCYHQTGNYGQAMTTLQEGLSLVARFPNVRAESYLLWSLGDLQRDRSAYDEAVQLYQRALELLGDAEPPLRASILISLATLFRWCGKPEDAVVCGNEAAELAREHRLALESSLAQIAVLAARTHSDTASQTVDYLDYLDGFTLQLHEQGARYKLVTTLGLCAYAALMCGDPTSADRYLQSALAIGHEIGGIQPLVAEVLHNPTLEGFVTANSLKYPAIVRDLKRLRDAQLKTDHRGKASHRILGHVTYSLRAMTLGQENVLRDGVPIQLSEWRATTARELFLYLLFKGPHSREDICLDFWPNSPAKRVRSNFHTTLYRARQALGENAITFQDSYYMLNPEIDIWCDAFELETLVAQARLLPLRDARTEDLWLRAVNLYRGDFLTSLYADWVEPRREAFREAYLEALIGVGECARARNDFNQALDAFRQANKLEPYREDIHRLIMTCYAGRGEKKKIHAHLQDLQRLLRHELSTEPSTETLAHAQALLN
jgi:LuxR family maltose regulon positive regulatory protein